MPPLFIYRIEVTYGTTSGGNHGSTAGSTLSRVLLDVDEAITVVSGTWEDTSAGGTISKVQLQTNQGRLLGSYGALGYNNYFGYRGDRLAFIAGRVDSNPGRVSQLSFIFHC